MDGTTKVYAVIGNPIEHSLSPQMQNFYGERAGLNLAYVPFHVENDRVGEAIRGALALNIQGINVTVPHKQEVMKYVTGIHGDAKAIGAVNTLVRDGDGYMGYNTDAEGLKRTMERAGIAIANRPWVLLGAGGAAKAAAYLLAREGAQVIYILNRNVERAGQLADYINGLFSRKAAIPMALKDYAKLPGTGRDFACVQSTSVGMYPNVGHAAIEDSAFYERISQAVDIVYTPRVTRFMELVREHGGEAVNGLDMLLYQGIASFELWHPDACLDEETISMARGILERELTPKGENVIFIGFMAAGKTSVSRAYAKKYNLEFVDTDERIEELAGMNIPKLFETQGEEAFRRLETKVLEDLLEEPKKRVISVGGGLPLRAENRTLLKKLGTVVLLDVSPETVLLRLGDDVASRPMLHADDVAARVRELLKKRRPFYEMAADRVVDVNERGIDEIVDACKVF